MPATWNSGPSGKGTTPHWAVVCGAILVVALTFAGLLSFLSGKGEVEPVREQESTPSVPSEPMPSTTKPKTTLPQTRTTTSQSTSRQSSAKRIAEALTKGRQALVEGDYNTAIRSYRAVLKLDPNNFRAQSGLANAQLLKEDHERIRDYVAKAEEAMKKGEYSAAIQAYEAALALDPDNEGIKQALQNAREASKTGKEKLDTASFTPPWKVGQPYLNVPMRYQVDSVGYTLSQSGRMG